MGNAIRDLTRLDPTTARAAQARAVAAAPNSSPKSAPSQSQSTASVPQDTVTISRAAKAAQLEAVETPVQTAKEARNGDVQAQRLLARESAAQKIQK
jgi:hypothetical protein